MSIVTEMHAVQATSEQAKQYQLYASCQMSPCAPAQSYRRQRCSFNPTKNQTDSYYTCVAMHVEFQQVVADPLLATICSGAA